MANYTFAASAQGWSIADNFSFDSGNGSPATGCMTAVDIENGSSSIGSLSISAVENEPVSFRCRVVWKSGDVGQVVFKLTITYDDFTTQEVIQSFTTADPYDSGWVFVSGLHDKTATVTQLIIEANGAGDGIVFDAYFDSVYVSETEPDNQFRILGIALDNRYFYTTSIAIQQLVFEYFDFATYPLTQTITFGTIAYDSPDSLTYGLYPVPKYGADGVVYLRGRFPGVGARLLRNDLSGTIGFIDVGRGTAGWGTASFTAAFLPSELNPLDWVVGLASGTFSYSPNGGDSWTDGGDIVNIVTASRSRTDPAKVLAGGAAGGSIYYSANYGQSFVSGGTVGGTVRWVEFS